MTHRLHSLCLAPALGLALLAHAPSARAQALASWSETPAALGSDSAPITHQGDDGATRRPELGVLAGVGFPRPLAVEGLLKFASSVALGAEYSVLPVTSISGVDTSFWAVAADARVFPLKGPFFIGLRAGRQHLGGSATVTVTGYGSLTESLQIDTLFLNPRAGLLWTWRPGFTLGMDVGVQVPLSSTTESNLPPNMSISERVTNVADTFGKNVIPTFDLLRLGVLL